jgi:hypothetical protein
MDQKGHECEKSGAFDGIDQRSFDTEPAVTVVAEDADEAADCYRSDKCH